MKDFLAYALLTVIIGTLIAVICVHSTRTYGDDDAPGVSSGSGTQHIGESDLVLPGGGHEMPSATAPPQYVDITVDGDMSDEEKLDLIYKVLVDALANFWDDDDSQAWRGTLLALYDIVAFGESNT